MILDLKNNEHVTSPDHKLPALKYQYYNSYLKVSPAWCFWGGGAAARWPVGTPHPDTLAWSSTPVIRREIKQSHI